MKMPYSYTADKAEGLRLQIHSEEAHDVCALRRAAELGNADAAFYLALLCKENADECGYRHWLKVGDEEGLLDATFALLEIAIEDANWGEIERYAKRVVDAPDMKSEYYDRCRSIAWYYLLQSHFRKDNETNEQFWLKVETLAKTGDSLAQELMARHFREKKEPEIAKEWYRCAAKNGNARAQNKLAILLKQEWKDKAVFQESLDWLIRAAENRDRNAEFNLGREYFEGIGVKRDIKAAIQWLEKASEHHNVNAMVELSELLMSCKDMPHDLNKSNKLMELAANLGHGNANFYIALRLLMSNDNAMLREAGYRLIVFHKICERETLSDWQLSYTQVEFAKLAHINPIFRDRIVKALSFYSDSPQDLCQRIIELCEQRAASQKIQVNDDEDGIVVNLHYIGPCNFNCKTCYFPRDGYMLPLDTWKGIVDKLVTSLRIKRFNLAGGEPLIANKDFVQGLIDHIHKQGVEVSIITNGYCLTTEFIDRNKGKICMIGISVDGTKESLNREIGRATKDGKILSNERLYELADCIHSAGIRLKINTQIMKPNCREDFHELIRRAQPERWKLLRTSIREDVNFEAKELLATEEEFKNFVERHSDLDPIVEGSDDIKNSYFMIFQYGEFVCVDGDNHVHMMPLPFGGVKQSIMSMPHNTHGYEKRYSDEK